jgi:3-oxoacyl-[acyl-carrier protein] reductase
MGDSGLAGRVALVTGAARGIGAAVCAALAGAGADIAAADLQDCAATRATVQAVGRRAIALTLDVTDAPAVGAAVDTVVAQLGRVDLLVCCAGIAPTGGAVPNSQQWRRVMLINVDGTMHCLAACWPHMQAQRFGRIVMISSMAAWTGSLVVAPEYSASKGAVVSMARHWARHGGPHNIRVNTVAPGIIATDMTAGFPPPDVAAIPLRRVGEATDVAQAVLFLCGPGSDYVTGSVLHVNGGLVVGV